MLGYPTRIAHTKTHSTRSYVWFTVNFITELAENFKIHRILVRKHNCCLKSKVYIEWCVLDLCVVQLLTIFLAVTEYQPNIYLPVVRIMCKTFLISTNLIKDTPYSETRGSAIPS